jgi:hypothetical protein
MGVMQVEAEGMQARRGSGWQIEGQAGMHTEAWRPYNVGRTKGLWAGKQVEVSHADKGTEAGGCRGRQAEVLLFVCIFQGNLLLTIIRNSLYWRYKSHPLKERTSSIGSSC